MFAIIGELEPSHQFRMSEHGSHAFARMKIVNGQCLVSTRCGQVDPWSIKHHFYESTIFTIGALESLDVLAISNSVNTDITILTCCQNVLMIVLKWKMEIRWQIGFLDARRPIMQSELQNCSNLGFEKDCLSLSYSKHSLAMMSFSNIEFPLFLCQ